MSAAVLFTKIRQIEKAEAEAELEEPVVLFGFANTGGRGSIGREVVVEEMCHAPRELASGVDRSREDPSVRGVAAPRFDQRVERTLHRRVVDRHVVELCLEPLGWSECLQVACRLVVATERRPVEQVVLERDRIRARLRWG